MGGAVGQTIAGVASTATHGGDLAYSAIGDLIIAVHLIAPGGQEYWIERTEIRPGKSLKLIDENELQQVYAPGPGHPGGAIRQKPIIYKRSDDLVNAALVSCGRMGVIYSVVLRTIRQYALEEHCQESEWKEVRKWIADPLHPTNISILNNRFVRIDVDVYPQPEFDWHTAAITFAFYAAIVGLVGPLTGLLLGLKGDENRAWIMTRNTKPLDAATVTGADGQQYPYGRRERGGAKAGIGVPLGNENDSGYFSYPFGTDDVIRAELTEP